MSNELTTYSPEFAMSNELIDCLKQIQTDHQSLDQLALQIKDSATTTTKAANNAAEGALITGALLIEAKKQLQHGEWETWVTTNCDVALRTAQAYMRLAKSLPQLDATNTQRVALLPLRDAMKAIATDPVAPKRPKCSNGYVSERSDRDVTKSIF